MAEYNVSRVAEEEIELLSGSVAELGDGAAQFTWSNCLECAENFGDSLALDYNDARNHFAEYGAWEREEIDAWSERELQALVIQEAASGLREMESGEDTGRIYVDDDGAVWLYLGI